MKTITKIELLNPESYLTVNDGVYEIVVFADEGEFNIGEEMKKEIHVFMIKNNISLSHNKTTSAQIVEYTTYKQHICAALVNKKMGIIKLGEFEIKIDDYIPNDICEGQFIEFDVDRLDIW